MKNLLFLSFSIVTLLGGCKTTPEQKVITVASSVEEPITNSVSLEEKAYVKMNIEGMTCAIGCAATIEKNLNKTLGIASAKVDFESKTAWVVYDATQLDFDQLTKIVKETGDAYSVSAIESVEEIVP